MNTPEKIKKGLEYMATSNVEAKVELARRGLPYAYAEEIASDAITLIRKFEAKGPQWISVKERLPDVDSFLGISRFNDDVRVYRKRSWNKEFTVGGLDIKKDIVWWMPLPEPPKEG